MVPKSVQNLIDHFSHLPGIGQKTAGRFVYWLIAQPESDLKKFAESLYNLKKDLQYCEVCYNLSEGGNCQICLDNRRKADVIAVVEKSENIKTIEQTGYNGLYHVLGGLISPLDGVGPKNLKIKEFLVRIVKSKGTKEIKEIVLATNSTAEGETTALYLAETISKLKKMGKIKANIAISRLAQGIPVGGDIEYADEVTMKKAMEGRQKFS